MREKNDLGAQGSGSLHKNMKNGSLKENAEMRQEPRRQADGAVMGQEPDNRWTMQ